MANAEQGTVSAQLGQGEGPAPSNLRPHSGTFLYPLVKRVCDPLEEHLDNLAALANTRQTELTTPEQQAMRTRARLRAEIDHYKEEYGLT